MLTDNHIIKIRVTVEAYTILKSDGSEATMTCEYDDLPNMDDIAELVKACGAYADEMEFVEHDV